jgi:DNA modification methylase
MIHHGDCLDVMASFEPESIDAICTDPPYGLEFMGKAWDKLATILPASQGYSKPGSRAKTSPMETWGRRPSGYVAGPRMQAWHQAWAREAFRVAKPSSYLLAFGGTRTVHRMACAIEDAGWIIRDMLVWAYASGFPKGRANLKPAWEPIVMARKPGPLRMLAIDECRIGYEPGEAEALAEWSAKYGNRPYQSGVIYGDGEGLSASGVNCVPPNKAGRWPANVILTDPIFDGGWDGVVGGGETGLSTAPGFSTAGHWGQDDHDRRDIPGYGDSGTYSRFFIIPKAARSDREPVLGGLAERDSMKWRGGSEKMQGLAGSYPDGSPRPAQYRANHHPTVKPIDLMRHLVRLVTPQGGTVLDPFLGSGTTGLAAEMEGFAWIGIERELEYVRICEARLNGTQMGMAL